MPDAIDQSWGYIDPPTTARLGVKLVADYLSYDTSKNWTVAQVKAYHAAGVAVLLNWESEPGRPLLGAGAGREDATEAVRLARALIAQVGQPSQAVSIVFSCDRDVNSGQWGVIDAYYSATKAIVNAAGFLNGAYGEADLIDHLKGNGLISSGWETCAWSGGRVSPNADLYQSSINDTLGGASVDFDQILNLPRLGAWLPPGQTVQVETAKPLVTASPQEDDEMKWTLYQVRSGQYKGWQYALSPITKAVHVSEDDLLTGTRFGYLTNPPVVKNGAIVKHNALLCEFVELANHNRFIAKQGA